MWEIQDLSDLLILKYGLIHQFSTYRLALTSLCINWLKVDFEKQSNEGEQLFDSKLFMKENKE